MTVLVTGMAVMTVKVMAITVKMVTVKMVVMVGFPGWVSQLGPGLDAWLV